MWGLLAPLIGSAVSGMFGQNAQNRQNTANMDMAKYQRANNIEFWNMQNAYNKPTAQMERLKEAGLNPNLIYGKGATHQASPIQVPEAPKQVHKNNFGDLGITSSLNMYYDLMEKQSRVENIEAQTQSIEQRTLNESLVNELLNIKKGKKGLEFQEHQEITKYNRESKQLDVKQKNQTLKNLGQEFRNKKASEKSIQADVLFKKHRNRLAKEGIYSSDNMLFRVLIQASNKLGISLGDILNNLKKPKTNAQTFKLH